MSGEPDNDHDAVLADMLRQAERLCACDDALLKGQYEFLKDRIRALIELRACVSETDKGG